jgi:hypothetical protein
MATNAATPAHSTGPPAIINGPAFAAPEELAGATVVVELIPEGAVDDENGFAILVGVEESVTGSQQVGARADDGNSGPVTDEKWLSVTDVDVVEVVANEAARAVVVSERVKSAL